MKIERDLKIERERPQVDNEPGYYTFPSAATEMPVFSETELQNLDLKWRFRTASLFSRAATSVPRAASTSITPDSRD